MTKQEIEDNNKRYGSEDVLELQDYAESYKDKDTITELSREDLIKLCDTEIENKKFYFESKIKDFYNWLFWLLNSEDEIASIALYGRVYQIWNELYSELDIVKSFYDNSFDDIIKIGNTYSKDYSIDTDYTIIDLIKNRDFKSLIREKCKFESLEEAMNHF